MVVAAPGRIAPPVARLSRLLLLPLVRVCFRPTLTGLEQLPARGPYLLVANHSGGIALAEILSFLALYLRDVGAGRPLAGFALPVGFRVFPLSALLRAIGAIPSTYDAAERALAAGVPILVFPGGDHEALRPIWQAHRVDFGGRVGFLRIARAAGVPIVPLGIRGAHFTAPVLLRSRWLATALVVPRLIGVKRWGLSMLGLLGALAIASLEALPWTARAALAWLWLGSPLVFAPWIPWTIRMRVGAPIPARDLFAEGGSTDAELGVALGHVQAAVQALVASRI